MTAVLLSLALSFWGRFTFTASQTKYLITAQIVYGLSMKKPIAIWY
jgi:hypothetical protein